jgi:RNA polymerase sigma-70 factor (ECF subfamily)
MRLMDANSASFLGVLGGLLLLKATRYERNPVSHEPELMATFEELHNALGARVAAYLSRYVGSTEAEDLAQEVFLKVHQKLGSFRGEAKLTTWVFQIATHAALDRLKSASHRAAKAEVPHLLQDDEAYFIPSPQALRPLKDEMCRCIRSLVDELPVDFRTIIYLSELQELGIAEIADILEITPGAAKIRLHRARQLLRTRMEQHCRIILDEHAELQCDRKSSSGIPEPLS